MRLADVHPLDYDALQSGNPEYTEISIDYAPILLVVLETKAAALARIVSGQFLEDEIGEPYRASAYANRYSSFWNSHGSRSQFSEVASALRTWRRARFAHAYLAKQRERGRMGPENDELIDKTQKVRELRNKIEQGHLSTREKINLDGELASHLLPRIRQIEASEAGGQDQLRELSLFVTQWEDWMLNKDYQNFATRMLQQNEVESKVASLFLQRKQLVEEWKSSEHNRVLKADVLEEYYNAHPWLAEEDKKQEEERRLKTLELSSKLPPIVTGDPDTTTEHSPGPSSHIQTHGMRSSDGKLLPDKSSFTISSGSLLWGQILPQYYSMTHPGFTGNASHVPPEAEFGTVLMHKFTYRSAARNGQWKVRRYNKRAEVGEGEGYADAPEWHTGYILYHESIDPMSVLERVRALDGTGPGAVSNRNRHTDKDILYVGRYDWSFHFSNRSLEREFQEWAEPVIGPIPDTRDPNDYSECNVQKSGYFIAVDEANFGLDLVAAYKRDCERVIDWVTNVSHDRTIEKMLRKDDMDIGTYLSMAYTGDESGWLVFSGEQHPDHEADELVAFLYDGSNELLESLYHTVEGD